MSSFLLPFPLSGQLANAACKPTTQREKDKEVGKYDGLSFLRTQRGKNKMTAKMRGPL
jgi:hypothetical protein